MSAKNNEVETKILRIATLLFLILGLIRLVAPELRSVYEAVRHAATSESSLGPR